MWSCPLCEVVALTPFKISILQKITPHNKAEVLDILLIEIQINEGVHMGMFQERKEWICDGSLYGRKQ
jgi:lipoprotein signal peptidase